jgi:hypothetical protein
MVDSCPQEIIIIIIIIIDHPFIDYFQEPWH